MSIHELHDQHPEASLDQDWLALVLHGNDLDTAARLVAAIIANRPQPATLEQLATLADLPLWEVARALYDLEGAGHLNVSYQFARGDGRDSGTRFPFRSLEELT